MKVLSYRGRRRLKRIAAVLGLVLVFAVLAVVVSFRYLERFMVYGPNGAEMVLPREEDQSGQDGLSPVEEYTLSQVPSTTVEALAPTADRVTASEPALIDITPEEEAVLAVNEVRQGYYITLEDLADPTKITSLLDSDPHCNTLVLELKSAYGTTAYTSLVEGVSSSESLDVLAVDALISDLSERDGLHLVALLPAFCDSLYALAYQPEGLPISGGALWMDWDGYYWLNPASALVQDHLTALCQELKNLGFDEIAFSDFVFPDSGNIVYDGNRSEALTQAAELLTKTAQLLEVSVSFWNPSLDGPFLPTTQDGFYYFTATRGSEITQALDWLGPDGDALSDRLVFCTDSHDTRFEDYSLLRSSDFTK